jgi:hypothetical protein
VPGPAGTAGQGLQGRVLDAGRSTLDLPTAPSLWSGSSCHPPADHRHLRNSAETASELYGIVFDREDQLEPIYDRLRQIGIEDPNELDRTIEAISGQPSPARKTSYRKRRKEMLLALLDDRSDEVDKAADELGEFFDHLRQVGIRGFVAERLNDSDYSRGPAARKKYAKSSRTPPTSATE